MVSNIGLF